MSSRSSSPVGAEAPSGRAALETPHPHPHDQPLHGHARPDGCEGRASRRQHGAARGGLSGSTRRPGRPRARQRGGPAPGGAKTGNRPDPGRAVKSLGRPLVDLATTLTKLTVLRVSFVSHGEVLDLATPSGRASAGMLTAFARFERDILRNRGIAGIAQACKEGRPHGRSRTINRHAAAVKTLAPQGVGQTPGWPGRARSWPTRSVRSCGSHLHGESAV